MIYKLFVFDNENQNCALLYDNDIINLNNKLLIRLIRATIQLGQEIDKSLSISLQEIEVGELQIGLLGKDNHTYIIVQDSLDNEAFTRKLLDSIIYHFHDKIISLVIKQEFEEIDVYEKELANFLNTMKFPRERLVSVKYMIQEFINEFEKCDTIFMTDLDDGIVEIWRKEGGENIVNILLEILSEMNFEKSWIGEIPQIPSFPGQVIHEMWIIYRLGYTDFCLCARTYYSTPAERELVVTKIENLTDDIVGIIQH